MSILSFTGSRKGLTKPQVAWLVGYLRQNSSLTVAQHGGAIGGDLDFHHICRTAYRTLGWPTSISVYPSDLPRQRAEIEPEVYNAPEAERYLLIHVFPPREPLERNYIIVRGGTELVACPDGQERLRSGTWATVRYARRLNKPLTIVYPDGSIAHD